MTSRFAARLARLRVPVGFGVGVAAVILARPTWPTLVAGAVLACGGEIVRLWAAGHLEKDREVTKSGPYRLVRHPLYLGSGLMGMGFVIAAARLAVTLLVLGYLAVALAAAIRVEEARLRATFGEEYAAYCAGRVAATDRRFDRRRVAANREHRAIVGLVVVLALLALKAAR